LRSDDKLRRSTQSALISILRSLLKLIGPFTPYIADEAWSFLQKSEEYCDDCLALQEWPQCTDLSEKQQACIDVQSLLDLKDSKVNESLENLRVKKEIGQSLDAEVTLQIPEEGELDQTIRRFNLDELAELFIVSQIIVSSLPAGEDIRVSAQHASGVRCPRSWRWVPELVHVEPWGDVSPRCAEVLANHS